MGTVLDSHFLALTAIIGYQLLFFFVTALLRFDKVTDFADCPDISCGSLGSSLGYISADEAVWVWTVSLPLTIVNASDRNPSLKPQDIIGWIMWFVGLTVEATADQQKLVFKNSPANRGKWCNIGVWKYSRHPNYFGEILLWWGIFVASTPVLEDAEWLVVFGPVFLTLLLLFVSGIPLLETSANKRFGSVEEYRIYRSITSPLIPLPPALYGSLPVWFKLAFLFELPLYSHGIHHEGMLSRS
ncbi:hypothetical protein MA16_Dca006050 [Dendrobium catenatum]|uniref:Uncharacterized protein n=1 Tax=Dendrobium catenatum TaxID=906689 RepID=A0A2I0WK23_9ASPA|nr:hypothetical protein MA16_Dca006050 [Dendrobium catenatum]